MSPTTEGEKGTGAEGRVIVRSDQQRLQAPQAKKDPRYQLSNNAPVKLASWPVTAVIKKYQPLLSTTSCILSKSLYYAFNSCDTPGRCYHRLHYADVESQAQRDQVAYLRSHSQKVAQMGFEPRRFQDQRFQDHYGSSKQIEGAESCTTDSSKKARMPGSLVERSMGSIGYCRMWVFLSFNKLPWGPVGRVPTGPKGCLGKRIPQAPSKKLK